jgi:predicted nucleic acid-binding protein
LRRNRPVTDDRGRHCVLVDSGAWIALVSANDSHHAEAEALFQLAIRRRVQLVTTNLVLAETHRFLLHRAGRHAAQAVLNRIDASPLLEIVFTTATHHAAGRAWIDKLPDQALTYTDALSFTVMRSRRCTAALTFDRHFTIAGFARWQPNE